MKNMLKKIIRFFRYKKLKRKKIVVASSAVVDKNTIFEGYNVIHKNCDISNCYVGIGTYIHDSGRFAKCKIGRWCSIGPNVKIVVGNHPLDFFSTHPVFYSSRSFAGLKFDNNINFDEYSYISTDKKWYCEIGNDVWIGEDVRIMNGVIIGDGAVIAAGALVTKDVEPYSVIGGVPAKVIKKRFSDDIINKMLEIKWWDKDINFLKNTSNNYKDIDDFLGVFK